MASKEKKVQTNLIAIIDVCLRQIHACIRDTTLNVSKFLLILHPGNCNVFIYTVLPYLSAVYCFNTYPSSQANDHMSFQYGLENMCPVLI